MISKSVKYKIMLAAIGVTLSSILLMLAIVIFSISDMVEKFSGLNEQQNVKTIENITKTSEETKSKITSSINESVLRKVHNLIKRDFLVLKEPFGENSFGWVSRFLQNTVELDDEIIHASFVAVQNGQPVLWYLVDKDHPEGISLGKNSYNAEAKVWEIQDGAKRIVAGDAFLSEVLLSTGPRVEKKSLVDPQTKKTLSIYDASIPVFDGEINEFEEIKADGAPIAFLHYQISLEKMQILIQKAEQEHDSALAEQAKASLALSAMTRSIGSAVQAKSFGVVGVSVVAVLVAGFTIISLTSKRIIQPILILGQSAEAIAQGDYTKPVEVQSDDEIGMLSRNFESMRQQVKEFTENLQGLVDERTQELRQALIEVEREKQKVSEILEQIEQGIVTFDESLSISPQYSLFLERFYGKEKSEIVGKNIIDTLFPQHNVSADDMNKITQVLKFSIDQHSIAWESNSAHLPREISINFNNVERVLALDWTPIERDGMVERIMLSIRDLTEQRRMEARAREADEQQKQMMEVVAHCLNGKQTMINHFIKSTQRSLRTMTEEVVEGSRALLVSLLRALHTLKGEARALGFKSLTTDIHEAESAGKHIVEGSGIQNDGHKILKHLAAAEKKLAGYEEIIRLITNSEEADENKTHSMLTIVEKYLPEISEYARSKSFQISMVECIDEIVVWNRQAIPLLKAFVMHGLGNAVDHGYVFPKANNQLIGHDIYLKIEARKIGDEAFVSITDHGVGLNLLKIQTLAQQRDFRPEAGGTIYDVLFLDGVSTTESTTIRSGRGIGLAAVYELVRSLNGRAWIKPAEPQGTQIILQMPLQSLETKFEGRNISKAS